MDPLNFRAGYVAEVVLYTSLEKEDLQGRKGNRSARREPRTFGNLVNRGF